MKINYHLNKKHFLLLLPLLILIKGFAQDRQLTDPQFLQTAFVDFNDDKQLNSIDAVRKFSNDLRSSDGSNFFNANWERGVVYFKNGQQYKNGLLQFDFVKNELHFLNNSKVLVFAEPVHEFTLFDTTNREIKIALFRNGYPDLGMHTSQTYYQVLSNGDKVHLLRTFVKNYIEVLPYDAETKKNYSISQDWFVYDVQNKTLQLINPSVSSAVKALPQYAEIIQKLAEGKKQKHMSEADLIVLMDGINKKE